MGPGYVSAHTSESLRTMASFRVANGMIMMFMIFFTLGMWSDENAGFTGPAESTNMIFVAGETAILNNEQSMIEADLGVAPMARYFVQELVTLSSLESQEGRELPDKFKRASFRVKEDREDRQRSQSRDRLHSTPRSGPSDVANTATGKGGKGQGKGGKGQGKGCFKCGKPGHKGAKCPEQSQAANTAQAQAEEPYRPSEESLAKIKMTNETLNITNFAQNTQARIEIVSKASLDVKDVTWYYENEYDPSP